MKPTTLHNEIQDEDSQNSTHKPCCDEHSEKHRNDPHSPHDLKPNRNLLALSIFASSLVLAAALVYLGQSITNSKNGNVKGAAATGGSQDASAQDIAINEDQILPSQGVELPFTWGDLGVQLTKTGVIDAQKFESLYKDRGGLPEDMKAMLSNADNGKIRITGANAPIILNIAWALGLGNKNRILDEGPMSDPKYGGAGAFAATGGWTLAKGDTMKHYSKHEFLKLTEEQQSIVERVSQNVYRPCCGNSTFFPDCNHGMAMLGLLELMASQNVSEDDMYRAALAINSYWFPDTYLTIAQFMALKGVSWDQVNPKEVLGGGFSSSQGFRQIAEQVTPVQSKNSSGCGV